MRLLHCCTQHNCKNDRDAGACPDGGPLREQSARPQTRGMDSFVVGVVRSRGCLSDKRIEELLSAAYSRQNVLEVVFALAMKTLSNCGSVAGGSAG
jgi:hypothetical protein